jgi:hypothetical protein
MEKLEDLPHIRLEADQGTVPAAGFHGFHRPDEGCGTLVAGCISRLPAIEDKADIASAGDEPASIAKTRGSISIKVAVEARHYGVVAHHPTVRMRRRSTLISKNLRT